MKSTNRNTGMTIFFALATLIMLLGYAGNSVAQSERRGPGGEGRQGRPQGPPMMDLDRNGKLSYEEASKAPFIDEERFSCLDKNNDGFLDHEEFPQPPRKGSERKSQDRAESTVGELSRQERGQRPPRPKRDADGRLTYEEALKVPFISEATFACFDADGDGFLSLKELPPSPRRGARGNSYRQNKMSAEPGEGK